jgi:acyl-CoA thioester hydrolase
MNPIHQFDIAVTDAVVDRNGHVNNVAYIQWLQDAAVRHARASGCMTATDAAGASWVVRSHFIEYLAPAFAGDTLTMLTWVVNFQKVRSLRKYKIIRAADNAVVARAETDWVFVNAKTGRPLKIPDEVKNTLPIVGKEMEPSRKL